MKNAHIDTLKAGKTFTFAIWDYKILVAASAHNGNMAIVLNLDTNTECEFNGNTLVSL